ncbi:polysaccharide lyase beta-sandwich domain-containing protein [Streptomyces carpaticus]|uniref:polysaccharide lyase family 8 super-sandwich domain-containing protein n=1 Tax=Streptomyces carpaticus TaxID=285558 RepID=UPI002204C4FA|nr:polysaccharide lyase beta-sandwich domain-containing protein [Streptomyces carpaticus]
MQLSRRTLLMTLALAASARPGTAVAADRAGPATVRANAGALFAGTPASRARPETAARLAAIAATARTHLAALDAAGPGELFRGLPLGTSDPNLNTTYRNLYEIALATRLTGDTATAHRVIDALEELHATYYGDQERGYYGNWFTWEIGIAASVSKTLVLLGDELAAYRTGLTATYLASMDAYLRNGKDGDVDLGSRFHTGANLADITTNRILQGAATGDDARIAKAVADQLTVYATVEEGDGFHADGSFIQHESVAYTGAYGKNLLTRAVQTIQLLRGTAYTDTTALTSVVQDWVVRGFAPVIFEGWMMEIVKGRTVSRPATGYADVSAVAEAVADVADTTALRGYLKYLHEASKSPPDPATFVSPLTIVRYADILADASVPAADLAGTTAHAAFPAMDRTVHRRPGWAFALARSSERISTYEYMNGENLTPWFQGDGAHYLYLGGQDQRLAHGVDYFTTVSPYHLAGVTVPVETRRTVPELYGSTWYDNPEAGFTASSEAQNRYVYFPLATNTHSGGARLDTYGTAALVLGDDAAHAARDELPGDFVTYAKARATKSWFLLDDEVVVLTAGITDPAGRALTTTLDTRIADPADPVTVTGRLPDGTPWAGSGSPAWLRYGASGHAVGYVFLAPANPVVTLETVTHSRRRIRTANADTPVSKRVFSLTVHHPARSAPRSLAHALVPHATEAQLATYAEGPLTVLANTPRLQAIAHHGLSLLAANTFAPGPHRVADLTIEGPASVVLRRDGDGLLRVAVADPTTSRDAVTVLFHGHRLGVVSADEGVRVTQLATGTRLRADTRRLNGRSVTATLR